MPLFEITSQHTGKTYIIDGEGTPTEDDLVEAGRQLDAQEARAAGVDPSVLNQKPAGTFVNTVRNIGPELLAGPVAGLAKLNERMGQSPLAPLMPLGMLNRSAQLLTQVNPLGTVERAAEVIQQEGQALRPVNPFNETAQTLGSAVNQIGGMLATGGLATAAGMAPAAAMSTIPAAMGFAAGAGQGIDTAQQMGITSPTAQAAMGGAFGAVEGLTERIGGIGGDAVNKLINPTSFLGRTALNTATEAGEEILTGRAQDALTVGAGQFVSDPSRPGFTRSGFQLPSLNPLNPDTLARMKQEAIGGAAGGLIFSGLERAANRRNPNELPTPQTTGPTPPSNSTAPLGRAPGASAEPGLQEDTGNLTAAEVADLESDVGPPGGQRSGVADVGTAGAVPSPGMPEPLMSPAVRNFTGGLAGNLQQAAAALRQAEAPPVRQAATPPPDQGLLYEAAQRGPVKLTPEASTQAATLADSLQPGDVVEEATGSRYLVTEDQGLRVLRGIDDKGRFTMRQMLLRNAARPGFDAINDSREALAAIAAGRIVRQPATGTAAVTPAGEVDATGAPKLDPAQPDFDAQLRSRAWRIAAGMQWDPQTGDWTHPQFPNLVSTIIEGELAASTAAPKPDAVRQVAERLRQEYQAGVSSSKSQVPSAQPRQLETSNLKPATLSTAYAAASQGQSSAFIPLGTVLQQMQQADPALTAEAFAQQVKQAYDAGEVFLEGANSQQEADAAGLRIEGTPVGTAVRMAMMGQDNQTRRQGDKETALQNPASRATSAPMASDSGAAQNAEPSPGGLSEAEVIRSIGREVQIKATLAKQNRASAARFSFEFYPSDDPAFEGDGYYQPTWNALSQDDKYLEKFVPLDSIHVTESGGFYVGDGVTEYPTLAAAQAAVIKNVADYLENNQGSFGINLDGKNAAREVFAQAAPFFNRFAVSDESWGGSKWGSWYFKARDHEGEPLKLSIRDHQATRADMGLPDKAWEVSKWWEPEEVANALAKAYAWLDENAQNRDSEGDSETAKIETEAGTPRSPRLNQGGGGAGKVSIASPVSGSAGRGGNGEANRGRSGGNRSSGLVLGPNGGVNPESSRAAAGTSPSLPVSESPRLQSPAELAATEKTNIAALQALGLPTKKGTRVWGGAVVGRALGKIAEDATKPATTRLMAGILAKADLSNLLLRIESDARLTWAGIYQPMDSGRGEIGLNLRVLGRGSDVGAAGDIATSLVHEALHHATYRAIRSPKNAIQKGAIADLEALRKRAKAALAASEELSTFDYELSNTDEFITGLFTRADFQTALAKIPAELAPKTFTQRVRSVLDEIFRTLAELVVGRKVEPGSVLDAAFAASLRLMEDGGPSVQAQIGNAILTQGPGVVTIRPTPQASIKAYHGTPHKVDKFTTAKIGTGEGAQAYGWGLYFAENAKVAEGYYQTLSREMESFVVDGKPADMDNPVHRAAGAIYDFGNRKKAIAQLQQTIASFRQRPPTPQTQADIQRFEGTLAVLQSTAKIPSLQKAGGVYTVELIPDESEFLDWDKPLSQQSSVLAAMRTAEFQAVLAREDIGFEALKMTGAQLYERIRAGRGSRPASEVFAKAGIPGIKYLDAGSRGKGDGSRNFVVFEDKHIRITHENGQPVEGWQQGDAGTPARSLQNPAAPEAPNETQSRFASPDPAQRVINQRPDAVVQDEARQWLDSVDQQQAIEAFVNQQVPLPLDAAEHAAAVLITRLADQAERGATEVERMWAHVQGQRMARIWTSEFLSADPARALRQRGVVNNTILAPIAPILAVQEMLMDRGKRVLQERFDGGTEGVVEKTKRIVKKAEAQAGEELARDLRAEKSRHPNLKKMLDALRKKLYPGMSWADIFMELPETQKERQREIYRRLKLDGRLDSLTPQERLDLTNELEKAWQRERRKVFMRELEKAGVLGEKKAKDREKVKAAAPRLLRLMNLGMLNSELFREAVAKEYGISQIDAATGAELRKLGEQIQQAPEGLPRRKLEIELMERLQRLTKSTFLQILDSYWTASVLSGWRTQVDIGLSLLNGIEDVGLGSVVTALRTGNKDVAVRALGALFGRIPSAFLEAVDHLATGNKTLIRNFELEAKQALENGNRLASDVGSELWNRGGWRKVPGGFMIFYGRLLTALDHLNSASTLQGAKMMALARHPELYQKALKITPADRAAAMAQAKLEMLGGAEPTTQSERLEVAARQREILERETPVEVLNEATEVGRRAALQGDPTGLGGGLLDMLNGALAMVNSKAQAMAGRDNPDALAVQTAKITAWAVPILRVLTGTKFVRTAAHALNRTTSYVPGVGFYTVGQQGRTGAFGDILMARQVIGTLAGLALYLAFDDDDDERGIEDSWKDKTPQEKAQLYAQGKQPFTVWERDAQGRVVGYNYQQWGIAGIMNTVAAMLKRKNSPDGWANVLASSLAQGMMTFTDKAQLQGLQTVLGDNYRSTDPVSGVASNLNKYAAQTVGGLVPRLLKDIDMVAHPELHSSSEWWQKWAKEVPMLRQLSSGKRVNIFGEDILLDRGPMSRVMQIGTADPDYRLLARLNAKDLYLPDPTNGVRVVLLPNGSRRDMNPVEKDRYQRLTGQSYRKFVREHAANLLRMQPEQARQFISTYTGRLRDIAAYQATR